MKRSLIQSLVSILLVLALAGCSSGLVVPLVDTLTTGETTTTDAATADSVAEVEAENAADHATADDLVWDEAAVIAIQLNGSSISADGAGVAVDGSVATITAAGAYRLSGLLADGQLVVDTDDDGEVRLILDGVDLTNTAGPALYVADAAEVPIYLAEDAENTLTDGTTYALTGDGEPNAALYSTAHLTIAGPGSLDVIGNYNDGLASQDGLVIAGGTLTVSAVDDGVRGKDYLVVQVGALTVEAGGDGLKSDNEEDATLGYLSLAGGTFQVTAGGDAVTAATDVLIADGDLTLTAGGGSGAALAADASAKGLKATVSVTVDGGTFTLDTADDAIHANGSITLNGGEFTIASGDDGLHADAALTVNAGTLTITQAYEGLESAVITLNGGEITVNAGDDGVNVAGGVDGSGLGRGGPGGGPGRDAVAYTGDYYLYINGGYLAVTAASDGLDVNGAIVMTDGVVLVHGPTMNMNGALDYDASFAISGGLLIAAGSAGMAQAPGAASAQNSLLVNLNTVQPAGALVALVSEAGETVFAFAPAKDFQSIAVSAPELVTGETYTLYLGGSATGTVSDGRYVGGTYTPGIEYTTITLADGLTRLGGSFR